MMELWFLLPLLGSLAYCCEDGEFVNSWTGKCVCSADNVNLAGSNLIHKEEVIAGNTEMRLSECLYMCRRVIEGCEFVSYDKTDRRCFFKGKESATEDFRDTRGDMRTVHKDCTNLDEYEGSGMMDEEYVSFMEPHEETDGTDYDGNEDDYYYYESKEYVDNYEIGDYPVEPKTNMDYGEDYFNIYTDDRAIIKTKLGFSDRNIGGQYPQESVNGESYENEYQYSANEEDTNEKDATLAEPNEYDSYQYYYEGSQYYTNKIDYGYYSYSAETNDGDYAHIKEFSKLDISAEEETKYRDYANVPLNGDYNFVLENADDKDTSVDARDNKDNDKANDTNVNVNDDYYYYYYNKEAYESNGVDVNNLEADGNDYYDVYGAKKYKTDNQDVDRNGNDYNYYYNDTEDYETDNKQDDYMTGKQKGKNGSKKVKHENYSADDYETGKQKGKNGSKKVKHENYSADDYETGKQNGQNGSKKVKHENYSADDYETGKQNGQNGSKKVKHENYSADDYETGNQKGKNFNKKGKNENYSEANYRTDNQNAGLNKKRNNENNRADDYMTGKQKGKNVSKKAKNEHFSADDHETGNQKGQNWKE